MIVVVRTTGFEVTLSSMEDMKEEERKRMEYGQMVCARIVFQRSQILVPVDTKALKESGVIEEVGGPGGDKQYEIGYGGLTAPYALWVHEDLTKYHEPPTQARFVSQAVYDTQSAQEAILQRTFNTTFTDYDKYIVLRSK